MKKRNHHKERVLSADFTELGSDDNFIVPEFLEDKVIAKKEPKSNRRAINRERKRLERERRHEQKELSIAEKIQEEWKLPRKKFGFIHFTAVSIVVLALAFVVGEGVFDKYFKPGDHGLVAAAFAGVSEINEEPISNQDKMDYKVPRGEPRYIKISSLGIDARVLNVGRNESGQIGLSGNIFDTAWFNESARPGETGAVVINGHLSGPTQDGVFAKISRLKPDDIITIERGDTMKFSYKVRKIETVRLADIDVDKLFQVYDGEEQGLNLLTGAGEYDRTADEYSDRTIIYSTFVAKK